MKKITMNEDDITDCPDCEGEGLPERTDTNEGWTKCGNCKGWMPPVNYEGGHYEKI